MAYYRTVTTEGEIYVNLVALKTKVSHLKKQESIPRLEMQAALMGAVLGNKVCQALGLNTTQVKYFLDSQKVLW